MDAIAVAADDPSSVAACGGFDEQRGAHQSSAWQDLPTGIIDGVAACLLGDSAWQPMQSDITNRAYPGDVQGFSEPSMSCSPARPPSARVRAVCRDWLASHDALLAHLAPVAALPPAGPNLLWATFPRLTSLDLRAQPPSCPLASILSACPTMATLAELWLPPSADDDLMPTLRRTPSLRRLSLRGSKVTDSGLAMLPSLTSLSVMDVGGCAVSDWGLEALAAAAPGLQELCVSELSLLTSEGLRLLSSLRWLRSLDVSGCENVCDAAINVLVAAVPSLTALDVSACWQVSDEGIISLCRLTGLASLTVENCWDVSDVGVRRLAALRSLRCLHLSTWQSLCTSGIPAIASLRHLSTLHISECLVPSDMDVHLLSRLPQLASLSLDCCEMLSDAALSCLGQMACLATLELSDCRNIRDPGIMSLRPLTSLRSLVISGCRCAPVTTPIGRPIMPPNSPLNTSRDPPPPITRTHTHTHAPTHRLPQAPESHGHDPALSYKHPPSRYAGTNCRFLLLSFFFDVLALRPFRQANSEWMALPGGFFPPSFVLLGGWTSCALRGHR